MKGTEEMARISKIVSDAMNEIAEECEMPLSADDNPTFHVRTRFQLSPKE